MSWFPVIIGWWKSFLPWLVEDGKIWWVDIFYQYRVIFLVRSPGPASLSLIFFASSLVTLKYLKALAYIISGFIYDLCTRREHHGQMPPPPSPPLFWPSKFNDRTKTVVDVVYVEPSQIQTWLKKGSKWFYRQFTQSCRRVSRFWIFYYPTKIMLQKRQTCNSYMNI